MINVVICWTSYCVRLLFVPYRLHIWVVMFLSGRVEQPLMSVVFVIGTSRQAAVAVTNYKWQVLEKEWTEAAWFLLLMVARLLSRCLSVCKCDSAGACGWVNERWTHRVYSDAWQRQGLAGRFWHRRNGIVGQCRELKCIMVTGQTAAKKIFLPLVHMLIIFHKSQK